MSLLTGAAIVTALAQVRLTVSCMILAFTAHFAQAILTYQSKLVTFSLEDGTIRRSAAGVQPLPARFTSRSPGCQTDELEVTCLTPGVVIAQDRAHVH